MLRYFPVHCQCRNKLPVAAREDAVFATAFRTGDRDTARTLWLTLDASQSAAFKKALAA